MTDSELPLALVAISAQASWFFPQLFTANAIEGLNRKKPVVVQLGLFVERLPLFLMVIAALLAVQSPLLALIVFFIGFMTHGIGAGAIAPAWQELLARFFPVDRRGRFFGVSMFLGAAMAAAGAFLSTWILGHFPFPTNFAYLFLIAAVAVLISWGWLALAREPVRQVEAPRQSNRQFWAGLPAIIRQDHNFRRFLIARTLLALGGMGTGFVTVSAVERWQVADNVAGLYTAAFLLGQMISNLIFGLLADRFGHKFILELSAMCSALAFLISWLAPASGWYFIVFALLGATAGAIIVSGILVVLEFCRPERRPTYAGIANTATGAVGMVSPLIGAALATVGYDWLFAVGGAVNLLALLAMRWGVREPRWAGVGADRVNQPVSQQGTSS
jgi:MFS family permease